MNTQLKVLILEDSAERLESFWKKFKSPYAAKPNEDKFMAFGSTASFVKAMLPMEEWDFVFLDHDLGEEKTCGNGMEVVDFIIQNHISINFIVVHSMNKPAAESMVSKLKAAAYKAIWIPFNELKI